MKEVYIIAALRTPIGSFGGIFANTSAITLGQSAVRGVLEKSNIPADRVDEVYLGNVVSANLGQAPARQVSIKSGLPNTVPCTTINKVCASGMKSVMLGAQSIMLGTNDIVITGGMENMSQIPFYVPNARFGYKYGSATLVDGLERDGLQDVYDQCAMGQFADQTADQYKISREEQDNYAIRSYERSTSTSETGVFRQEIIPVEIPQRKGSPVITDTDEEFSKVKYDKIPGLRPAFTKNGTVTAANASTINDGAASILLASKKAVEELGLSPIARIVSFADASHDPARFTIAPTIATPKALKAAGIDSRDIDYYEVNEAFSVVPLVFGKLLKIDPAVINVHGGAVSLGHPLGASGARIIVTLVNVLATKHAKMGLATICNGGGGASSIIIEKL